MSIIDIEKTKSSPEIFFDKQNNELTIEGESYPENSIKFYEPVFNWLNGFLSNNKNEFIVNFKISYMNSSSTKCIMNLIDIAEEFYKKGNKICIKWFYDEENEMLKECAEDFKEDVSIPFEIIPMT